jgi:hypothetical protein
MRPILAWRSIVTAKSGYVSSVGLMILGHNLEPHEVSHTLDLKPSASWRKGETKGYTRADGTTVEFDSQHKWGGWRMNGDPQDTTLGAQLARWCDLLRNRSTRIEQLRSRGCRCYLDVFLTTDDAAFVLLPQALLGALASLGVDVELSIWAGWEDEGK